MATDNASREQGFRQAFQRFLGRDPKQDSVQAFLNSGLSVADRTREILQSPEFRQRQRAFLQPTTEFGIEGINAAGTQQETEFQTLLEQLQNQQQELSRKRGESPQNILGQFASVGRARSSRAEEIATERDKEFQSALNEITRSRTNAQSQRALSAAQRASQIAELRRGQRLTEDELVRNALSQFDQERQTGRQFDLEELRQQFQERQIQAQTAQQQAAQRGVITSGGQQRLIDLISGDTVQELGAAGSPSDLSNIIGGLTPDQIDSIPDNILQTIGRSLGFEVI